MLSKTKQLKNNLIWYPPAETKIPIKAILQSLIGNSDDAEQILREITGSRYCYFGPSGRSLLFRLLKVLHGKGKENRNEVLIPGYTCYSVAAAIVKAGLKIRFYDIDSKTLNPDNSSLKSNIRKQTLAIISQHLFGIPIDLRIIENISLNTGVYHIEDAAQAFGAKHHKKSIGTQGDFGLFSFGRGKPLPLGGGGALISNNHDLDEILEPIRARPKWNALAINIITQIVAKPIIYGLAEMLPTGLGETIFDPNFEVGDIPLSIKKLLKPMMNYFHALNIHRIKIASIYRDIINKKCLISVPDSSVPIYHRFPVLAKKEHLTKELRKFGVRRFYPNALNKEIRIAAKSTNSDNVLLGSETLASLLITLPTNLSINEQTAMLIALKINKWIGV